MSGGKVTAVTFPMRAFRMRLTRDLTALMFEMEGTCPTATRNENNGKILRGALDGLLLSYDRGEWLQCPTLL